MRLGRLVQEGGSLPFDAVAFSSAQDSSGIKPTRPPQISLGQVYVAKLRAEADEPTVTLVGHSTRAEVRTRVVVVTRLVPEQRTRVVVKDGKSVEETYTVQAPVKRNLTQQYTIMAPSGIKVSYFVPAAEIQAWDVTGKLVEGADLVKRLEKPKHVFMLARPVTEDRPPIDALYRGVLRDDVLLVYAPRLYASAR